MIYLIKIPYIFPIYFRVYNDNIFINIYRFIIFLRIYWLRYLFNHNNTQRIDALISLESRINDILKNNNKF